MAEEHEDRGTPSLEAPSLFGRRRRKDKAAPARRPAPVEPVAAPPEPIAVQPEPVVAEPIAEPVGAEPVVAEPVVAPPEPVRVPAPRPARVVEAERPAERPVERTELAQPAEPAHPWVTGQPAAVVAGLVVGAFIVAATAASMKLCAAVEGTSSCGGSGFFLLVLILVVAVLVGGAVLRAAQVPDPVSTAFLAVGLLSVVTLLLLVGSLFQWWMAIVIPVTSVLTFVLSHWVTTTYADETRD